jgi:hypothetical protein
MCRNRSDVTERAEDVGFKKIRMSARVKNVNIGLVSNSECTKLVVSLVLADSLLFSAEFWPVGTHRVENEEEGRFGQSLSRT